MVKAGSRWESEQVSGEERVKDSYRAIKIARGKKRKEERRKQSKYQVNMGERNERGS